MGDETMPYKFEKIKLKGLQDRRRKLTEEQMVDIRKLYETGNYSLNKLATRYKVSKKTILLIVNLDSKRKNDEYIKGHWKNYELTKEERNKAVKKLRDYKKNLYEKGELK